MKKYCDNCENEVETKVITKKRSLYGSWRRH